MHACMHPGIDNMAWCLPVWSAWPAGFGILATSFHLGGSFNNPKSGRDTRVHTSRRASPIRQLPLADRLYSGRFGHLLVEGSPSRYLDYGSSPRGVNPRLTST